MTKTRPFGLLPKTVTALRNRPAWMTFAIISTATGLSERWLSDFANGRMAHPSVVRVQDLHDYLVHGIETAGANNAG